MKLHDLLDLQLLDEMMNEGYVGVQTHPDDPRMRIFNYTHNCQWDQVWNDVTRSCRGLIVYDDEIVARPFPKFFNVGQHDLDSFDALPTDRPFDVWIKLDGSLGILYTAPDGLPAVATRGSFASDQAKWATAHYREMYADEIIPLGVTFLFEIIYPQNRIVVDYGDMRCLVALAAIDNETGAEVDLLLNDRPWPRAHQYDGFDIEQVASLVASNQENAEGFVLRFAPSSPGEPSLRAKVKFDEYVRLHRILTNLTSYNLYEYAGVIALRAAGYELKQIGIALRMDPAVVTRIMETPDPLGAVLEKVPDEFYAWVQNTLDDFDKQIMSSRRQYEAEFAEIVASVAPDALDRRSFSSHAKNTSNPDAMFRLFDEKPIDHILWRAIRPEYEKAFTKDVDA